MQVCEEAVKLLKNSKRRPIKVQDISKTRARKKDKSYRTKTETRTPEKEEKSRSISKVPLDLLLCVRQGTLHISGDGLRVADSETKGLVLDQTIEKVTVCSVLY